MPRLKPLWTVSCMRGSEFWRRLAAVVFAFVFLFGGLAKLADPVGAGLVVSSYLNFLHIGFLSFASKFLGVFFALVECAIGIVMLSGVWMKEAKWPIFILLGFFTLLTLLLLILNPPMDCGCFGELVHLTHLQSFIKNLILFALLVVVYLPGKDNLRCRPRRRIFAMIAFAAVLLFASYGLTHLPILDLTDLRAGTELSEGSVPVRDEDGQYRDDLLLDGDVLVVSVYAPEKLSEKDRQRLEDFAASSARARVIVLSAGNLDLGRVPLFQSDRKSLLSLNRSNGGVTYISDALVTKKWDSKGPSSEELSAVLDADSIETIATDELHSRLLFGIFGLVLAVLLLV